ncbi:hypothetical protein ACK39F_19755, partial [Aeromonas veronii]
MMNPFSWLQMTNMISYQGLVRTFPNCLNAGEKSRNRSARCTADGVAADSATGRFPIRQGLCGHASGSGADKNGDKKREPQAPSLDLSAPVF